MTELKAYITPNGSGILANVEVFDDLEFGAMQEIETKMRHAGILKKAYWLESENPGRKGRMWEIDLAVDSVTARANLANQP